MIIVKLVFIKRRLLETEDGKVSVERFVVAYVRKYLWVLEYLYLYLVLIST